MTIASRRWDLLERVAGAPAVRIVRSAASRREVERLLRLARTGRLGDGAAVRADLLGPGVAAALREAAPFLASWPVGGPDEAERLTRAGVTALIVDDLALLARLAAPVSAAPERPGRAWRRISSRATAAPSSETPSAVAWMPRLKASAGSALEAVGRDEGRDERRVPHSDVAGEIATTPDSTISAYTRMAAWAGIPKACSRAARLATRQQTATSWRPTAAAASRRRARTAAPSPRPRTTRAIRSGRRRATRAGPTRETASRATISPARVRSGDPAQAAETRGQGHDHRRDGDHDEGDQAVHDLPRPHAPGDAQAPSGRGRGVAADGGVPDDVAELCGQELARAVPEPVGALNVAAADAAHAAGAQPHAPDQAGRGLADGVDDARRGDPRPADRGERVAERLGPDRMGRPQAVSTSSSAAPARSRVRRARGRLRTAAARTAGEGVEGGTHRG